MKILAIDTSCDDTSVAVVELKNKRIKVLSNIISSQVKIHSKYGGVYPALAKREHQKNLVPVLTRALENAELMNKSDTKWDDRPILYQNRIKKILQRDELLFEKTQEFLQKYKKPPIDAIAVTNGPGLEPCLWQGVNFAKALAFWWNLPLIPVNHIKAHLSANFIDKIQDSRFKIKDIFPAVGLVASGGHTELVLMQKPNEYKLIGTTRDDAAGECFDKTARILGLSYPGGPVIAELAKNKIQDSRFKIQANLPRPMINSQDFDFSFSGLKTAVLYDWKKRRKTERESNEYKTATAKEIQQAIIDVLISKALKAAKRLKVKSIISGGGVMANRELRKQFQDKIRKEKLDFNFFVPDLNLCLDNAAMVGADALLSKPKLQDWRRIKVNANLNI